MTSASGDRSSQAEVPAAPSGHQAQATPDAREPRRVAIARGIALFIGAFSLLNIVGQLLSPGFDANLWWIDFRPLPAAMGTTLLGFLALFLLAFSLSRRAPLWRRATTVAVTFLVLLISLWNAVGFYGLLRAGGFRAGVPVPFSLLVSLALGLILWALADGRAAGAWSLRRVWTAAALVACVVVFPLAQVVLFGMTDYRRPADVAVVLGAHVYADGRLSDVLAERVRTGARLYNSRLVPKLIMSGGPGEGSVHETEAMRDYAASLGVNPDDILLDRGGLNTWATVHNTTPMFSRIGTPRVLVVSHFYHLPRIKMAYQRAGVEVWTVPSEENSARQNNLKMTLREVAALWVYYLRPLAR